MDFAPTAQTVGKDYQAVDTIEGVAALAGELRAAGRFALRVLPDTPSAMRASIVGLAFSTAPRQARYVPFTAGSPPIAAGSNGGFAFDSEPAAAGGLDAREALDVLRPVLEDPAIKKIGHDLKFDAIVLARHGVAMQGLETDTMIASYLVDANRSSHPLEELALEHTGYKALTEEDVCGRGAKSISFSQIPVQAALDYARRAIRPGAPAGAGAARDHGPRDARRRSTTSSSSRSFRCWWRSSAPASGSTPPALASQAQRVDEELYTRARRIYELSGEEFNINSPKKLGEILFDKMGLTTETLKRTSKTKAHSTAFEVLEELGQDHELPRLVLEWRGLMKLKGTYIDALPQLVNPETGRVHTCFNQAVAATGRLSSSDPNLQNIPIRTELGREIRRRVRGGARPRPDLGGLFADRAARAGASLGGSGAARSVHAERRHPRSDRAQGLRRRQRPQRRTSCAAAPRSSTTRCSTASRRSRWRRTSACRREEAQEFIDAYFAGFPSVRAFIDGLLEDARAHRHREDDVRPPPAGARAQQPQRPGARRRRARRRQHADPGLGGRHPEEGDDRRARRACRRSPAAARA